MAQAEKTKLNADDFLALPESNLPHELIDGEEVMSPAPKDQHQKVSLELVKLLISAIPGGELRFAPADVRLDNQNVVQPDIFWVSNANQTCMLGEDGYWQGAPDLIIEILSPGTTAHDRVTKFRLYEKSGVSEYWIVDPAEHVLEAWQLAKGKYTHVGSFLAGESFASPILGGKDVSLSAIFAE